VPGRNSQRISKPINEINLTPLIDLSFLLLITFIITFPLVEQGIPVNLPKASAADIQEKKACSVTLNAKGELFLDEARITSEQLRTRLAEVRARAPETAVFVRADESLAYGKIVSVLKILHELNITKMALVTEAEDR
jgi:biopolymer transport protein TolR